MPDLRRPVYLEDKLKEIRESGRLAYRSRAMPTWCPGCGYYAITEGVTGALNKLGIANEDVVIVSGIGCAARFPFFMNTYGVHSLHGRALPVATGVKLANDRLTVIAAGGDGDGFAIGGGHIPHAVRRNLDITYILFDNGIYGLTKGQISPTTDIGFTAKIAPYANRDMPLNPIMMLLAYRASWVGQTYAGHPHHLADMLVEAIAHPGFSYLHVLSPCVTFDKTNRTYHNLDVAVRNLPEEHDPSDLIAAMKEAEDTRYPAMGLFYRETRPTLADNMDATIRAAGGTPPAARLAPPRAASAGE